MANSSAVVAGQQATATQYNTLRDDVLNATTGHGHTGGTDGKLVTTVPTNLIAHTTDVAAPTGWTEYLAGRGRVIVGTPLSGTAGGTVGTALTNLQDPTHTHTGPSHQHTIPIVRGADANHFLTVTTSSPYGLGSSVATDRDYTSTVGGGSGAGQLSESSGSGNTGATSATMPYVQLLGIQKS